ncbi:MAG TPA: methyltransferase domain-containing protein [Myxococcota bacterium]|nr:methyltransferase domain-containing protein [Myxococcota bacterium]
MAAKSPADERRERIAALGYDYPAQPVQRAERCNLCGSDRFVTIAHRDRYGYPASADGCLRCGLVFLNPALTRDAYAEFYRSVYRPLVSAYHGRRIDAESIQHEQREYAAERADFLAPRMRARGCKTLLDVGGSTGVVAHALKQRFDLHATVIDPAPLEIDVARRLGLETVTGFVEDYDSGGATFDLIVLCQAVDHLLDVALSLSKIRDLISPWGLFFVDIVDFRAAYRRNGCVEEAIKIDHPYYLTDATMRAYLERSGFELLAIDFAADHLHVGYLCAPATRDLGALPEPATVDEQWREIRAIQNPLPRGR